MGTAEKRHQGGHPHREFILALHDFALLFDGEGKPLNPPEHPGSDDAPGVMGINYRCEPMPERLKRKNDPARIFSSFCYGDPATPILETYPGEPMVIRLLDGAHEEQHILNITGLPWRKEITDPASPPVQAQASASPRLSTSASTSPTEPEITSTTPAALTICIHMKEPLPYV